MSNLNVQQRANLMALKSKETRTIERNPNDPNAKKIEYEEDIKPTLNEKQINLIKKYLDMLSPLGGYQESSVYELIKKYDWSEKAINDIALGLLKKREEAGNFEGWTEVKKVEKPQPQKPVKNFQDSQRNKRYEKDSTNAAEKDERKFKGEEQKPYKKREFNEGEKREYYGSKNYNQTRNYNQDYYENNYYNKGNRRYYKQQNNSDQDYYYAQKAASSGQEQEVEYVKKTEKKSQEEQQQEQPVKETLPQQERPEPREHQREPVSYERKEEPREQKKAAAKEEEKSNTNKTQQAPHTAPIGRPKEVHAQEHIAAAQEETRPIQRPAIQDKVSQRANKPIIQQAEVPAETLPTQSPAKTPVQHGVQETNQPSSTRKNEPIQHQQQTTTQASNVASVNPSHQPTVGEQATSSEPQQGLPMSGFSLKETHPIFPFPYIVFPQPNGTCIIQPFTQMMMPPMIPMPVGTHDKDPSRGFPAFPQVMPMHGMPSGFLPQQGNQASQDKSGNRQQMGMPYINFPGSEGQPQPQMSQYPYMPMMLPPGAMPMMNYGMQQFASKPSDNPSGHHLRPESFFQQH